MTNTLKEVIECADKVRLDNVNEVISIIKDKQVIEPVIKHVIKKPVNNKPVKKPVNNKSVNNKLVLFLIKLI